MCILCKEEKVLVLWSAGFKFLSQLYWVCLKTVIQRKNSAICTTAVLFSLGIYIWDAIRMQITLDKTVL
jgi:hypothetical protein